MKALENWLNNILGSKRTTIAAILGALPGIIVALQPLFDGNPETVFNLAGLGIAGAGSLVGLFMPDGPKG